MEIKGRTISKGVAVGEALVTSQQISFYGGVDPDSGIVVEKGHELEGKCIAEKVLVFPSGKGSTVGSYTLYRLRKNNKAPAAIINKECDPVVAVGAIISGIPLIDKIEAKIKNGDMLKVDANRGIITVL
ncbi:MAG: DUF126 domain-containing protein [Candidatus Aenigmatarchaeota archaeon]|nr:DUF126 domain-containing protein [Candidatus Aenigmarchaeota archaeon]